MIAQSRRRHKRKELVVMKACERLHVYDYTDVMKQLRAMARSRSSSRSVVCAREVLTEKEVIRILMIASGERKLSPSSKPSRRFHWHKVLHPGTKRKATRYQFIGRFRRVGTSVVEDNN